MAEPRVRSFFATQFGPVTRTKMGGGQNDYPKFAFVEFTSPLYAQAAAKASGIRFGSRDLKIAMSSNPILSTKEYQEGRRRKDTKYGKPFAPPSAVSADGTPNAAGSSGAPPSTGTPSTGGGAPSSSSPSASTSTTSSGASSSGAPSSGGGGGGASGVAGGSPQDYSQHYPASYPAYPQAYPPSYSGTPYAPHVPPAFPSPPRSFADESMKDLISRTIYVSGIDHKLDEADVKHFFGMAGRVTACRIRSNPAQDAKFAFVEFSDRLSAQNALQCSGQALGKKTLKVSRSNSAIQTAPSRTPFSKISMEDRERILRTIYVGRIDHSLTEEQIGQFFADCGPIQKVALAGDESHPTRFAFVEFEDIDSSKNALSKDGQSLCGQLLEVRSSKTPIYQKGQKRARSNGAPEMALEEFQEENKRRRVDEGTNEGENPAPKR